MCTTRLVLNTTVAGELYAAFLKCTNYTTLILGRVCLYATVPGICENGRETTAVRVLVYGEIASCNTVILETLIVAQLFNKYPAFMEPSVSLPCAE